eukprot:599921-Pyramimonas_sp.AAC.1
MLPAAPAWCFMPPPPATSCDLLCHQGVVSWGLSAPRLASDRARRPQMQPTSVHDRLGHPHSSPSWHQDGRRCYPRRPQMLHESPTGPQIIPPAL